MASNPYINKVIYGNQTLLDVSTDDVTRAHVLEGKYFHLPTGERTTGTCSYDADTSDATAATGEILDTKTAYVNGSKVTGSMPNRGAVTGTITTKAQSYSIQNGYHDGSGSVSIASAEQDKIVAGNIRNGVTILGVEGTYAGDPLPPQTKTATPYTNQSQDIEADSGYVLSKVTVQQIAYEETDNAAGGKTVTIGTVAPVSP